MARQVVAVLVLAIVFSIFDIFSFGPASEFARETSAAPFWHFAFPYLASSFVLVAVGVALTSSAAVDLAANRIVRAVSSIRMGRRRQVLVGLSVQFGLGSVLAAVLALRTPCEIASNFRCFSSPLYDLGWAAAMSIVVAGCGANAHAIAKASMIISDPT